MKPPNVKSFLASCKFFKCFLAIILFFSSCDFHNHEHLRYDRRVVETNREWMTRFFANLMIFENGIYTLWGSKPVTLIIINDYSAEELKAYYDSLTEEEKKNGILVEDDYLKEDWEKWEKINGFLPMKGFLLFRSNLYHDPHASYVFFVNILKTAIVIQENYDSFRRVVGFDFNPLEIVFEMNSQDSKFWQSIRNNNCSHLWGLIFGYGKTNSYAFHWKNFDHTKSCEDFFKEFHCTSSNNTVSGKANFSIKTLDIPPFMSFEENDEIIERYQREKTRIQKLYSRKNFLDLTLDRLTR